MNRRLLAAGITLAVIALTIVATRPSGGRSPTPEELYTVGSRDVDHLTISVDGTIDNQQPVGHLLPYSWVPLKTVTPEGQRVSEGDVLVTLDEDFPRNLIKASAGEIDEQQNSIALSRLQKHANAETLKQKRDELESQRKLLEAQIEATRVKDQAEIAIAELDLKNAEQALASANQRLAAIRALADAGHASQAGLRQAIDRQAMAEVSARAPRLHLELLKGTTGWSARAPLQNQLADVINQLGNGEDGGIYQQIETLEKLDAQNELVMTDYLNNLLRDRAVSEAVLAKPEVDARASGMLRYSQPNVRKGLKMTGSFFAFVLKDEEASVTFRLPDKDRELIQPASAGADCGRAVLRIPALGNRAVSGKIISIAAVPEDTPGGTGRAFTCVLRFDEIPKDVLPGMSVQCELQVPTRDTNAVIPTWCVNDINHPVVTLGDGESRELSGFSVGHDFVVVRGLQPGDQLRLSGHGPAQPRLRLSGIVQPAEFLPIKMSSWNWEVAEIIPDGSRVAKGDVIARLNKDEQHKTPGRAQLAFDLGLAKAKAQLAINQINAQSPVGDALVAWRQAELLVEKDRLRHLLAALPSSGEPELQQAVKVAETRSKYNQAKAAKDELHDAGFADSLSLNERKDRELAFEQARIALMKESLDHARIACQNDWTAVIDAAADVSMDEMGATQARSAYSIARMRCQRALAGATAQYRGDIHQLQRKRAEFADETIIAPRDGYVFQKHPLKVGDKIWNAEPFYMPTSNGREFTVEVPARLFGTFQQGQEIPFVIPVLGTQPRPGKITKIAAYFADSAQAREDQALRGSIGVPDKIFYLSIGFTAADSEIDKVTPGTTAYVDL